MRSFFSICILLFASAKTFSKPVVPLEMLYIPVDSILARMPAQNKADMDNYMKDMAALGPAGWKTVEKKLNDTGDITAVEYLLNGFSYYVAAPGQGELRSALAKTYLAVLPETIRNEKKAFLIRQLEITGGPETVPALSAMLVNDSLADPAARALLRIHTPDAGMALAAALKKNKPGNTLAEKTLIQSLGDFPYPAAAPVLTAMIKPGMNSRNKTIYHALAQLGLPASAPVLITAVRSAHLGYDSSDAASDYVLYLRQLIKNKHTEEAKKAGADVLALIPAEKPTPLKAAVITVLETQIPYVLSPDEKKAGFELLFDGITMNEWLPNQAGYGVEDGTITVHPIKGAHGNLYTKKEYADFIYRFEFQLTAGANNGIGIRAPLEGDAAYVGMEIQVLDNEDSIYKSLHEYQYHGSVYGVLAAKRGFLKPVGEWNTEEITAKGNKITVVLNGTTILDGDITESIAKGTADGKDHPGLKNKTGHLGFLGHGDVVRFRRMRVKTIGSSN